MTRRWVPRIVSKSIPLEVPARFAFAFVADPATATVIDPAVRRYAPDRLPMDVGTTIDIRFRLWGLPVRATSVVREWIPGRRMVMASVRPARPVEVVAEHRFEGDGDRCVYTWTIECRPIGLLGQPAAAVMSRFWRANARAQQTRLKVAVEDRCRSAS